MAKKGFIRGEAKKFDTIREMVALAAAENPDQTGFMYKAGKECISVTYSEFAQMTYNLGQGLADCGFLGKENRIACVAENSFNWIHTYVTVLQSDSVYVPVDPNLPVADLINVLNHSGSTVVFCSAKFEKIFREHRHELPNVRKFVCFALEEDDGDFLSFEGLNRKGSALYEAGDREFDNHTPDHNETKLIVYTSGTTGNSKGVMLSEHNIVSGIYYGLQTSKIYTKCLSVLPYNHTYEMIPGILVAIHHRSVLCINDRIPNVMKNMQYFKPDYIYLVPAFVETFYKKIWAGIKKQGLEKKIKTAIKLSYGMRRLGIDMRKKLFGQITDNFGGNLREIVCGGAPLRPEVVEFFDAIGIDILNGYGITECSPLVSVNQLETNNPKTVGYPLPCLEIRIYEPDEEGNGEICVKGDVVMLGYYKNKEATDEVLIDGWFHTGDFGRTDELGRIVINGRKKNLIVLTNGKNIYPEEIEALIARVDYIKEVIVSGIKDESGGEIGLKAEVYLDPENKETAEADNDTKTARLKADIAKVLEELPSYKRISEIVIRDEEFAKNTSNKIKRNYN